LRVLEDLVEHNPPPAMIEVEGGLPPLVRDPDDPWPGVSMPPRTIPIRPEKSPKP
jgi:hypothetical protein